MDNKKLTLSQTDKKIGGVCGGLANYLGVDATVLRIIWALCIFLGGCSLIAYLACWLLIPKA